jgi:hypothetical protein
VSLVVLNAENVTPMLLMMVIGGVSMGKRESREIPILGMNTVPHSMFLTNVFYSHLHMFD